MQMGNMRIYYTEMNTLSATASGIEGLKMKIDEFRVPRVIPMIEMHLW